MANNRKTTNRLSVSPPIHERVREYGRGLGRKATYDNILAYLLDGMGGAKFNGDDIKAGIEFRKDFEEWLKQNQATDKP